MPDSLQRAACSPVQSEDSSDSGYMLMVMVVLVALVLIALSVAAPIVAKDLRRQKELESQHRAQQYVRAIRLYYRRTHSYPPSIDALKNTNNVRFLRQEYVDPLTGKSDWKLIHLGEQKTTIKGFFGQELGGISAGGLGSAAGMNSGVGTPIGGGSSSNTNCVSGASALAGGFNGACATSTTTVPGTAGVTGGSGATGSTGSSGSTGSTGSTGGLGGGGVIIGVDTAKTGSSISQPNQQTTYETWEFWYDPRIEQLYQKGVANMGVSGGGLGSTPASSFGNSITGQPNTPGSSPFSNSPPGSPTSSPLGSPTTSPTAPTSNSPTSPSPMNSNPQP